MANTYAQMATALTAITESITQNRKRLAQAKQTITVADAELGGLAAAYGAIGSDIDVALAADPTNTAILHMDAEWDLLVAEFQALKAVAAAQKAALA